MTGPSGSGKTTLLTLIGALRRRRQGASVLGRELVGASARPGWSAHRREIGFIFQHHNLFSSLTALENVRMATALRPAGVARDEAGAAEILDRLGPGATGSTTAPAGSPGGQRQRVAIARALVNRPGAWSWPTSRPPPSTPSRARPSWTCSASWPTGPSATTVLIVTHDQRLLDRADRIVNMVGGRIVSNVRPRLVVRIFKVLSRLKELRRARAPRRSPGSPSR